MFSPLFSIILTGLAMMAVAGSAGVLLTLKEPTLQRLLHPLIAFAAGALFGSAFFHMLPESLNLGMDWNAVALWVCAGFLLFLILEQALHWHHHLSPHHEHHKPVGSLLVSGDVLHNLIGGLVIAEGFLLDFHLGLIIFFGIAVHELPHELGDLAVLIHSGWKPRRALLINVLASSTVLMGGLIGYTTHNLWDATFLIPITAGTFIYIGVADLLPEVMHEKNNRQRLEGFLLFVVGLFVTWVAHAFFHH